MTVPSTPATCGLRLNFLRRMKRWQKFALLDTAPIARAAYPAWRQQPCSAVRPAGCGIEGFNRSAQPRAFCPAALANVITGSRLHAHSIGEWK